jgi:hypothetical protein
VSRKSDSSKEAVWRRRLRRFEASNVSVVKFCAAENCSEPSFYYWRNKLAVMDTTKKPRAQPPAFHQLSVPLPSTISIELPGGAVVTLPGNHLDALRTIVREALQTEHRRDEGGSSC